MKKLRTFISSLRDVDGGLAVSLGEKADPNNAFLIKHLIELDMQDTAKDFKSYLLKRQRARYVENEVRELKREIDGMEQDENGGFPKGQPSLDTTLNTAYFLYETGFHEKYPKFKLAINFLASCRNSDGGWPDMPGEKSVLWATLETAALLRKLGKF